jgi:hypothetical protein
MSEKFVTLSFTHQTWSDFKNIMRNVIELTYDSLATHTELLEDEPGYLTEIYLKGYDIDSILQSVREAYENKTIDCDWTVVD